MIIVHEIKLNTKESTNTLPQRIESRLHIPKGSVKSFRIVKESVDARKKPIVMRVFSVEIESDLSDDRLALACEKNKIKFSRDDSSENELVFPKLSLAKRPVVAGFGPCGMFAALCLAKMGLKPVVLERGSCMEKRIKDVEHFFETGVLDKESNVQFGEGGAGTFSDGKLTTGTRSEYHRFILESFVRCGADEEILYKQKPHIGTDVLRSVVVGIRKEIEALGGEVRFDTRLDSIKLSDGKLSDVILSNGETIKTDVLILALGHSSRDTLRMLFDQGISMEQKAFSMGVRIEHPQDMIDMAQYGALSKDLGLGPADYKLSVRTGNGRGVYTFCMCPGGYVINASSAEGMVCTNGMSYSKRDSGTANSGYLSDVYPSDFGSDHPLAGMYLQEKYEHQAFEEGGGNYALPKESVSDFLGDSRLKKCLPEYVYNALKEALPLMGKKLEGFDDPKALMTGIESRSSSPVRVLRDESYQTLNIKGIYPAGEGAGYAGGIVSAAADGMRVAFKVAENELSL